MAKSDGALGLSIERSMAHKGGNLGDAAVVTHIFRELSQSYIDGLHAIASRKKKNTDVEEEDTQELIKHYRLFTGHDAFYLTQEGWHTGGGLAAHLRAQLGLKQDDDEEVVFRGLERFRTEVYKVLIRDAEKGVDPQQTGAEINKIIDRYVRLFMGLQA